MDALLFGGAFNPPTRAHIELAFHACRSLNCSHVIFVPTKTAYIQYTQKKDYVFRDEQRLSMLQKIAGQNSWMIVSDYEMQAERQPRTYETLQALKERYACKSLRLLIGTDKLAQLNPACGIWKHTEEIAKEFGYAVMERNADDAEQMMRQDSFLKTWGKYFAVVRVTDEYRTISSGQVRRYMQEIKERQVLLDALVPKELDGMRAYLYGEGD